MAEAGRGEVFSSMCLLSEKLPRAQASALGVEGFTALVLAGVPGAHAYVAVAVLPCMPLPEWSTGEPLAEKDASGAAAAAAAFVRDQKMLCSRKYWSSSSIAVHGRHNKAN